MLVDLATALERYEEAVDLGVSLGSPETAIQAIGGMATVLRLMGRWDDMTARATEPHSLLEVLDGVMTPEKLHPLTEAALIDLARGGGGWIARPDVTHEAMALIQNDRSYLARITTALIDRQSGDRSGAVAQARRAFEESLGYGLADDRAVFTWTVAADWSIEAGDFKSAAELLQAYTERADQVPPGLFTAQEQRIRGAVAMADPSGDGSGIDIEDTLRSAMLSLRDLGAIPESAKAQATLAVWLLRQHREDESETEAKQVLATFDSLGALAWAKALAHSLESPGHPVPGFV
jgi:hypothetical protein